MKLHLDIISPACVVAYRITLLWEFCIFQPQLGRPAANVTEANGRKKTPFSEPPEKPGLRAADQPRRRKNRYRWPKQPRMYVFFETAEKHCACPGKVKISGPPASLAPPKPDGCPTGRGSSFFAPTSPIPSEACSGPAIRGCCLYRRLPARKGGEPAGVETSDGACSERATEEIRQRVFED